MTFNESAVVLKGYLNAIQNIEEMVPGPIELEALDTAAGAMEAAVENVEYGAFAWDREKYLFVQIGRSALSKQLCLNRYREKAENGTLPAQIDPNRFKILRRTVAEIVGDWNQVQNNSFESEE